MPSTPYFTLPRGCRGRRFSYFLGLQVLFRCFALCLLLGTTTLPGSAQEVLKGVVFDAATHAVLPGVTLRFQHLPGGTTSQENGTFTLPLPTAAKTDTLLLSRVGYARVAIALRGRSTAQPQHFLLPQQQVALQPVSVQGAKLVERNYGVTQQKALIHFTDGTIRPGEAFEIAQLIRLDQPTANLTSVNLFMATTLPDSATVAIHFYGFDGQQPTHELKLPVLRQRVAIRAGWLRLNLPALPAPLPATFVVGVAFAAASTPIPYEIKLGGSAKSFARTANATDWRVPPHHYRLYVTALVPRTGIGSRLADRDSQETPPTASLYSAAVQDSFQLYVRLPTGYRPASKRAYPVILLLDANAYFDAVSAEATKLPPAILVGIGYRNAQLMDSLRQRDYTYPVASSADSLPVSGGGQRFLHFLTDHLLPYLDQHYHTDSRNRTLMGHSLGGYFVLYALAEGLRTQAPAFTHYVAASPSLYYQQDYLQRTLPAQPAALTLLPAPTVLLTVGGREIGRGDAESRATQMALNAYTQTLAACHLSVVTLQKLIYPDYGHLETAVRSFVDGWKALPQAK